jgi:hypothetical protein
MRRLNNLVNGLAGYLQFEFGCYRSAGFNERGFSSSMIQLINGSKVECEKPHPFLPASRKPKCVDYFWNGWGSEGGNYMEFKWFGNSSPVFNSMLTDIYRLGAISCRSEARTYFVIAGVASKIAKSMNSTTNERIVRGKKYSIIRTDSKRHPDIKPSHIKHLYDPVSDIGNAAPLKVKLFNPHFSFNPKEPNIEKFGAFGFEVIGTLK